MLECSFSSPHDGHNLALISRSSRDRCQLLHPPSASCCASQPAQTLDPLPHLVCFALDSCRRLRCRARCACRHPLPVLVCVCVCVCVTCPFTSREGFDTCVCARAHACSCMCVCVTAMPFKKLLALEFRIKRSRGSIEAVLS